MCNGRMDWVGVSGAAAERGLVNADGEVPTPTCCKQTWERMLARLETYEKTEFSPHAHNRARSGRTGSAMRSAITQSGLDDEWQSENANALADQYGTTTRSAFGPAKLRD